MSTPIENSKRRIRDGTSQAERRQPALEPDYVRIDERRLEDLLAFARDYAKELHFYDENNEQQGDWSGFIDPQMDLEQAAAYARDPDSIDPHTARPFARPHFALYLTFSRLLHHAQEHLNTFTRRHLEFYYQKILGMTKKTAVADRVNVLLRPTPRVDEIEVPQGHLLGAGRDSLGRDRFYRTDRRIVVNHARITRLSAVFADRRVTGIREAREHFTGTRKDAFLNMLAVALGDPLPGDPLPEYTGGETIDYDALLGFETLLNFTRTGLFHEFFELRDLMRFKRRRDNDDDEWVEINTLLEVAGKKRSGDPDFRLEPEDPRDFDANLVKALDGAPNFDGLPQVENIDDLYDQRTRNDVKIFVRDKLFFSRFEDFERMMQIKRKIDSEWKGINGILEMAGRRKRNDDTYRLAPEGDTSFDPTDFQTNFDAAVGPVEFSSVGVNNLDEYYYAVLRVKAYFFVSAENFVYIMYVAAKLEAETKEGEWEKVYDILAGAYREKVYDHRRADLKSVREDVSDVTQGFNAMLYFALGEEPEEDVASPLERLRDYMLTPKDFEFLESVEQDIHAGRTDETDWERVYRVVELAQRVRERFPEPVARVKKWVNLHAHEDVTAAQAVNDPTNPRWKTFGNRHLQSDVSDPPNEIFGWAIGSPLLLLDGGARQVVITLGFKSEGYDVAKIDPLFARGPVSAADDMGPFRVQVTTEEGWTSPDTVEVKVGKYNALSGVTDEISRSLEGLQFILIFSAQVAPIVAPSSDDVRMDSKWPLVRLMLRQIWGTVTEQYITHYAPFEPLQLVNVHLKVEVGIKNAASTSGLGDIRIQNEQTILDSKKPFHPFGTSPVVGSRFYLAHPELVHKRLDSLRFGIEWMGAPTDLKEHYKNYAKDDFNWTFKTHVSLVDKRVAYTLDTDAPLFAGNDATVAHTIENADVVGSLKQTDPAYVYRRSLESSTGDDLMNWDRYLQWELTPLDFQHQAYPAVSVQKSVDMAAAIANKVSGTDIDPNQYKVNPPYTPKIKALDVHYAASLEFNLSAATHKRTDDRIFHVHPFGYNEVRSRMPGGGCRFLPQYSEEGELYIGVAGVAPPQRLSVLFQMAEGSANPDLEPVSVEWSYLSNDEWLSLADGGIQMDTTRGLINTGIIDFELRSTQPSTRLPEGYYWIRASISRNSDSVCDTVAIHAQAVSATLIDNQYAPDHYSQPLPAKSITNLSPPIPGIAEVLQPYTSFGGKPHEQDSIFYTRVSERLRHKQRVLTIWDYERLVLERFPHIYKAKCLPANVADNPDDVGKVTVIVIPDVRNRLPFDPFAPKAPADLIADIQSYLNDKIPPYANVDVRNAHYVPVKVRIGVRFESGYDVGFYKERLIEDLNRFLSPWAYQEGADIVIGGRIYANSIVNFLDQREYVDYVAEIKLFSSEDGRTFRLAQPLESQGYFVTTEKPDGVLVAAPRHEIDVIAEAGYEEKLFTGINYMKIELDFVVG